MLELKDIKKVYKTANEEVMALKGINIKFRKSEFVSILGQSGCGKTTLLNIIGGLDRYTSGDLIINGKSTKKFKDRDWDAYRNYKIGFVFQSYNLISHQTILSNVELSLTIGGISGKERRERAIKALEEVGLKDHIHKKPNQLSGGQMQRVAIARALVNNPDIILADEPTGALDTKTSIQVMEILKNISKDRLIIMVTHNPELAEKYSSRIIKILDGLITEDSNPIKPDEIIEKDNASQIGRTAMRFWTALHLSLNNLLTKKGRTFLVAFAGSIGIIGIALVQSVSNGFQAYVDKIQEDTLTSYPLTIQQESTDVTGMLLAMAEKKGENDNSGTVTEEQYITKMLASISTNDLKSFRKYVDKHFDEIKDDVSSIQNSYSVSPIIYGTDSTGRIAKLNPSSTFGSSMSMGMMSAYTSAFSQMSDDKKVLDDNYEVLAGRYPEKYDEMIVVLSAPNSIPDLIVYSLGLRDTKELKDIVTKIMDGEKVDLKNEPLVISYEDLMNLRYKLIMSADLYKYNEEFDVYEDMSDDEEYMKELYDKSTELKIVGVVCAKEGTSSTALTPGVAYRSDLVDHVIDYAAGTDIVKKQLADDKTNVLSGKSFDDTNNKNSGADFSNIIQFDFEGLQSAFNFNFDQEGLQEQTEQSLMEIAEAISTDTNPAKNALRENLEVLAKGMFNSIDGEFGVDDVDSIVKNYMKSGDATSRMNELSEKYIIPAEAFSAMYEGLLSGLLQMYIPSYSMANTVMNKGGAIIGSQSEGFNMSDLLSGGEITQLPENFEMPEGMNLSDLREMSGMDLSNIDSQTMGIPDDNSNSNLGNIMSGENGNSSENNMKNMKAKVDNSVVDSILQVYLSSVPINEAIETMGNTMTETAVKVNVMTKVGELIESITTSMASAFNIDQSKITNAFKINVDEDEITRVVSAMFNKKTTTAKSNLIDFGYQDKEEPTYISIYFTSFDGKENFKKFIDEYNDDVPEEKEINYTDTTGLLMGSVKTIVNAVTYVLIAFISISLVVSSMMIGIITYISVYERTKEIGILRAIGASKGNISSIFNAETFIIGLLSGLIGITITYLLLIPINAILHSFTGNIPLYATFYPVNAIILVILSVVLTLIGGLIPAKSASKRDPVIALRTE